MQKSPQKENERKDGLLQGATLQISHRHPLANLKDPPISMELSLESSSPLLSLNGLKKEQTIPRLRLPQRTGRILALRNRLLNQSFVREDEEHSSRLTINAFDAQTLWNP